jgi:hypothetical protein
VYTAILLKTIAERQNKNHYFNSESSGKIVEFYFERIYREKHAKT